MCMMFMIYLSLKLKQYSNTYPANYSLSMLDLFSLFTVIWVIATKSVIFGHDARLTCHSHACPRDSSKKWFGGKNYDLLCLDGNSANPAKYEMVSNESDYQFDLTIKNFSLTDTNCSYTCACEFQKYTNMLLFDDFIFTCKFYDIITN